MYNIGYISRMDNTRIGIDRVCYRDVFCCLGTTRAAAGGAEPFRKIDHDYVVNSAKIIAEENPGTSGELSPVHYLYCSSAVSNISY
jgi:hypothetical protein